MIVAQCHCGHVCIEIPEKPESITECNCSICRRYGAMWAYYRQDQIEITTSVEAISAYVWGDKLIEFFHCNNCGCITHYESVDKHSASRIAVNARMLPTDVVVSIPIKKFDGADTWKYLEE